MSMIGLDAMEAIMEATESLYGVSARDMVKMFRHLDDNGWQLIRKPEPIVEPTPEPPVAAMVISPSVFGNLHLWTLSHIAGEAIHITSEEELLFAVQDNRILAEGQTEKEAMAILKNPDSSLWDHQTVMLDGRSYEYLTNNIPF